MQVCNYDEDFSISKEFGMIIILKILWKRFSLFSAKVDIDKSNFMATIYLHNLIFHVGTASLYIREGVQCAVHILVE